MSPTIPSTHRVLVFDEYEGPLIVKQHPVPVPKDDEILIRILYSGICHSDLHCWQGDFSTWTTCPRIGGHEGAGEVVQVGSAVDDWKVGDKAGVKAFKDYCYKCEYCKKGEDHLCPHWKNVGFTADGAFQEYIALKGIDAVKIDPRINLAAAAPILCAGTTVYKALKISSVKPGEFVVLTGAAGGLGTLGIQYAKSMGMRVIAVDHPSKKEHCIQLGAEYFVDGFSETMADEINKLTDGGAHGIVNLAIPKEPMEKAIDYLRKMGTLILVAIPRDTRITIDINPVLFKLATIKGTILGTRSDMDEALDFVARGAVQAPYELVRLEDVPDVYKRLEQGKVNSRCVIDMSLSLTTFSCSESPAAHRLVALLPSSEVNNTILFLGIIATENGGSFESSMVSSWLPLLLLPLAAALRDFHIDYAGKQFIRDGQPYRYISGSIHYFRTHPAQWEARLQTARAAGLNAIQTYIPWNFHETYKGQYDFSGPKNFTQFFLLAQQYNLSVLVRPGPYICAEWENGGLPYWLLKYPNISLRSSQEDFLRESLGWWDTLLPLLKPLLWNNGGPIIMTQLENEYGSYGCDRVYLNALRDKAQALLGADAVLYTTDPPEVIKCGKIDGVFATVDFGERGLVLHDEYFTIQSSMNNNSGPRVNSEYYPGWYLTWGEKKPYKDFPTSEVQQMTEMLYTQNASFNYYMFHGGTNFGFWNGEEYAGGIITSYDYWAPMHENGDPGDKYNAIRQYISQQADWPYPPQPTPPNALTISGKNIAAAKYGNLMDYLPMIVNSTRCVQGRATFEDLDQPFGFVQYSYKLTKNVAKIQGDGIHDFGYVFVNGRHVGTLSPHFSHKKVSEVKVDGKTGDTVLIIVENQGRLTWLTAKDPKGILADLQFDGSATAPDSSCPIDIESIPQDINLQSPGSTTSNSGDIWVGQFYATKSGDTNIDLSLWGKGVVWVNGFNLGRYWSSQGPQKSLFIPAPVLQQTNEVVILEWEKSPCPTSNFCQFDLLATAIPY